MSELYLLANRFGILDQGKIIREISKAEFETLSEDYIVLKTSDKERACQVLKEQTSSSLRLLNPENEIHIFGNEQDVKQILKQLTCPMLLLMRFTLPVKPRRILHPIGRIGENHDTYHSSRFYRPFPLQRILDYRIHSLCTYVTGGYYWRYRASNVSSSSTTRASYPWLEWDTEVPNQRVK